MYILYKGGRGEVEREPATADRGALKVSLAALAIFHNFSLYFEKRAAPGPNSDTRTRARAHRALLLTLGACTYAPALCSHVFVRVRLPQNVEFAECDTLPPSKIK